MISSIRKQKDLNRLQTGKISELLIELLKTLVIKKAECDYIRNSIDDLKTDPHAFWTYIRSKRMDRSSIPTLKKDSKLLISDSEKAAALADHFNSVFTIERDNVIPFTPSNYPIMDNITIRNEGVLKLLMNLDTSKASGPDEITTRMLKETVEEIAPVLTSLFKQSLDRGTLPDDWLLANVTALFKKGSREP